MHVSDNIAFERYCIYIRYSSNASSHSSASASASDARVITRALVKLSSARTYLCYSYVPINSSNTINYVNKLNLVQISVGVTRDPASGM